MNEEVTLDYLEFYSGVGGWTMALEKACSRINRECTVKRTLKLRRVAFFDHSDLCNHVFQYNFGCNNQNALKSSSVSKKIKLTAIEKLTLSQLEGQFKASIWTMSPPCQPHTRQHSHQDRDIQDPRSQSFLHLCSIIEHMAEDCLPKLIFIENVIGFEQSDSFDRWRKVLQSRNYAVGHFHLTPTQFNIPNDRPRYYGIAVRFIHPPDTQTHHQPISSLINWVSSVIQLESMTPEPPKIYTYIAPEHVSELDPLDNIQPISDFLDASLEDSVRCQLTIPSKLLKSTASWCLDIVQPCDRRSSCFTHSYGKWARGTGSVLYVGPVSIEESNKRQKMDEEDGANITRKNILECIRLVSPEERKFDAHWLDALQSESDLRYLTGHEMARLMGFPVDSRDHQPEEVDPAPTFRFPPDVTMKQQWKLMGNSLNVVVAAAVVELGLSYFLHLNQSIASL